MPMNYNQPVSDFLGVIDTRVTSAETALNVPEVIGVVHPDQAVGEVVMYVTDPYGSGGTPSVSAVQPQLAFSTSPLAITRGTSIIVDGANYSAVINWTKSGQTARQRTYRVRAVGSTSPFDIVAPNISWPADIYLIVGATEVLIPVILTQPDNSPCQRSYSFEVTNFNGSLGFGDFGNPDVSLVNVLPSQGSRYMVRVPILHTDRVGDWQILLRKCIDTPNPLGNSSGYLSCRVHIVSNSSSIPSGYTPPASFVNPALPAWAPPLTPIYTSDFISSWNDWLAEPDEFTLNGMQGLFVVPGLTKTLSGANPICYTVEGGVRTLRFWDARSDNVVGTAGHGESGRTFPWGAPYVRKTMVSHAEEWRELDADFPSTPSQIDPAWWGYVSPSELDHHEGFNNNTDFINRVSNLTFHSNSGNVGGTDRTAAFRPWGSPSGRKKRQVYRNFSTNKYMMWIDGVLVIETFDYGTSTHYPDAVSIEGPGGTVAGTYNLATDYSQFPLKLYGFKYWGVS